ncbi:MAG: CDP-alcohol phosphatidyltransferase family protein [Bdellovibrionales bacterium]|nr:CDP-alcohol phosphatidyltransferase family protein [Bdellovibrionales bacterium]
MPTIYELKPAFQRLLRPIVRSFAQRGVTPNQVTLTALVLSLAVGVLLSVFPRCVAVLILVPGMLFLRMALNAIDGMLAREHDMKSLQGAVLNELGDVISDAGLYFPFALIPGLSPLLVVSIVTAGIVGEMTGVVIASLGGSRRYDGPLGKSDRAFAFGLIAVLISIDIAPISWLNVLLAVLVPLSLLTIANRARMGLQEIETR